MDGETTAAGCAIAVVFGYMLVIMGAIIALVVLAWKVWG